MGKGWIGVVVGAALLAACGTESEAGTGGDGATHAATFTELRAQVFASCNSALCHASAIPDSGNVILRQEDAYAQEVYDNLVGAATELAAGRSQASVRVKPGDPEGSFLWWKLLGHDPADPDTPVAGLHMPNVCASAPCLPQAQLEMVRSWIAAGAKND